MQTLGTLKKRALRQLRDYANTEAEARTPVTRNLAKTLVDVREHFDDAEGNTDWTGRTYPYRRWVRDLFDEANLRGEDSKRVQAAVRYHIGTVLRERLSAEELERIGMLSQTPRERSGERRATRSAVLNALNSRDVAGGALMGATAARAILQRIDVDEFAAMDESAREVAESTLKDVERRARALLRRLR